MQSCFVWYSIGSINTTITDDRLAQVHRCPLQWRKFGGLAGGGSIDPQESET